MTLQLTASLEKVRLAAPFRISGYVFEHAELLVVTLSDGANQGRGEAAGVYYTGDNAAHMMGVIEDYRSAIEAGIGREELRHLMPPGGARNAVDCALWELEAKQSGQPVWKLAAIEEPDPLVTTFTLSADAPEKVEEGARNYASAKAIKLKLDGDLAQDIERVRAVRRARPDVWLGVDANQGYGRASLDALVEVLVENKVGLLEQPLARGHEADLDGFVSPIPVAADESALCYADLEGLVGRFDVVNIKLDKCGGLTEGLAMARRARELGLKVMVGNMIGTSLAMAPAYVLGQLCDFVDLDGPTFLLTDRDPAASYKDGTIAISDAVWGASA